MATFLRILIFATTGWLAIQILISGIRVRTNPLGNPPIARLAFFLAKLSVSLSFLMLILEAVFDPPHLSTVAYVVCICLLIGGTIIFTLGMFRIGGNLRMGRTPTQGGSDQRQPEFSHVFLR